jgi:hypothetical protein
VPAAVAVVVEMFSVHVPEPVMELGLHPAVIPAGTPLSTNVTAPLNPLDAATVRVKLVLLPAATVCELGDAVSEKSGGRLLAVTVTLTATLCVSDPLVPMTVNV